MAHNIYKMSLAKIYPLYVNKAERKGKTKQDVDTIICWLTGYTKQELDNHLLAETTFEDFFAQAENINPNRSLIKGVVCGVRVENITDSIMQEIRYLDKLIDELANGKSMIKILR